MLPCYWLDCLRFSGRAVARSIRVGKREGRPACLYLRAGQQERRARRGYQIASSLLHAFGRTEGGQARRDRQSIRQAAIRREQCDLALRALPEASPAVALGSSPAA